jgi:hypothetical protein
VNNEFFGIYLAELPTYAVVQGQARSLALVILSSSLPQMPQFMRGQIDAVLSQICIY